MDTSQLEAQRSRYSRRQMFRWLAFGCGWAGLLDLGQGAEWPARWQQDGLRFHANFPLNPNAPEIQDTLDLQQSVPRQLGLDSSGEPIFVFLFADKRTYEDYLRQYFPGVPQRRALFIKQQGPGMVFAYASEDLAVDLRHETTHAVLHRLLPMVPLWLDEGLAEYFEVPDFDRFKGNPHLKAVQRRVRWRRPPSLATLEATDQLEHMDSDRYRDAWSWVHYLLHGPPDARDEFTRYLADIRGHTPPGQLSRRLERRVPDLSRSYTDHFVKLAARPH